MSTVNGAGLYSEDSPDIFRRVKALLHAESTVVAGGHLIDPAHPAVLDFIDPMTAPVSGN